MQVWAEVVFDPAIKVFNLSIALRMSWCCLGVLDIQDGEEYGWWSKSINPAIQDHLRHRGSFLVRNWHDHCYFGESIGRAKHVFVVAR